MQPFRNSSNFRNTGVDQFQAVVKEILYALILRNFSFDEFNWWNCNLCDVHHKASRGNTCSINFRKRNSLNIVFWEKPTLRRLMTKMDKIII